MKSLFRFAGKALLFLFIFAIIIRIIAVMGGSDEDMIVEDTIAVVHLDGVILDTSALEAKLKSLDENKRIKGVIIEINSPGGAIAPTQKLYLRILKMKKPVYAVMDSIAASGGYYTAVACDKIYALDSTITGSIGVIMEYSNIEGLLNKIGIRSVVIKSGKMKDVPSPTRTLTKDEQAYLQANINDYFEQFLRDVLKRRPIDEKQLRSLADGRIFSGRQAVKLKLIDKIGTQDEAVDDMEKEIGESDLNIEDFAEDNQGFLKSLMGEAKSFGALHLSDGGIYYLYKPGL